MYTPPAFPAIETPPQEANRPSFEKCLASWKWAVSGKKAGAWPQEIMAASLAEFINWQSQLMQAKIDANKHGYQCQFNKGGSKSGCCAAWVVANGHTFKIAYTATKTTRSQAVTQTSREAYAALDLGPKCEAVARVAIRLGLCTDNEVAREIGMVPSLVSARRNDIEKAGGIVVDGQRYSLKMEGSKVDGVTGRRANTWALMADVGNVRQIQLFQ